MNSEMTDIPFVSPLFVQQISSFALTGNASVIVDFLPSTRFCSLYLSVWLFFPAPLCFHPCWSHLRSPHFISQFIHETIKGFSSGNPPRIPSNRKPQPLVAKKESDLWVLFEPQVEEKESKRELKTPPGIGIRFGSERRTGTKDLEFSKDFCFFFHLPYRSCR